MNRSENTKMMIAFILILHRFRTSVEDEYRIDIIHIALQLDVGILTQSVFIILGLHYRADDESFRKSPTSPLVNTSSPFSRLLLFLIFSTTSRLRSLSYLLIFPYTGSSSCIISSDSLLCETEVVSISM